MSFELVKIEIFSRLVPEYLKALTEAGNRKKAQTVTFDFVNRLTQQIMLLNRDT